MSSIINQDIKGVIYIIGLIVTCFLAIIIGNVVPDLGGGSESEGSESELKNPVCNLIALGDNVTFSKLPLGQTILMYTFFYFVYVIAIHNLALTNIPTLIFFPILILADIWWNFNNNCYNFFQIIVAFIIGGGFGIGWSAIIDSYGQPSMMYYNVGSNANVCSRPSKQLFKCTFGGGATAEAKDKYFGKNVRFFDGPIFYINKKGKAYQYHDPDIKKAVTNKCNLPDDSIELNINYYNPDKSHIDINTWNNGITYGSAINGDSTIVSSNIDCNTLNN
jgi:hypothetical protein